MDVSSQPGSQASDLRQAYSQMPQKRMDSHLGMHCVCRKWPMEDDECRVAGERAAPVICGFNTGLLSLTASGSHPISVPAKSQTWFPLHGMMDLTTHGVEFILL